MSDSEEKPGAKNLVLDYDLDAPPEKVWRAISIPALRDQWLPAGDLADAAPVVSTPGEELHYRMRENTPPFGESRVTFQVRPGTTGGTRLRIIHQPPAANGNTPTLLAA